MCDDRASREQAAQHRPFHIPNGLLDVYPIASEEEVRDGGIGRRAEFVTASFIEAKKVVVAINLRMDGSRPFQGGEHDRQILKKHATEGFVFQMESVADEVRLRL